MFRRMVMPLMIVSAMIALVMVVRPTSATGSERHGDTYVFNRNASITKPVGGTVQVYNGNLKVGSTIAGDLLVVGGSVTFVGAGRVDGNLIYTASRINDAQGRVGGNIYPLLSPEGAAASMASNAVVASLLLVWLVAAIVVTLTNGREIRLSSIEIRTSTLHCFVLGLVALTSFVLTAIAFSYLVPYLVGIPLLAALGVFAILTKAYGMIAVFHAIGTIVAGSRTRDQLAKRTWLRGDLAMVVLGVLLLGAIRMIPVVGTVVWALTSIFGVGVAMATRFGRREPWFLELRRATA